MLRDTGGGDAQRAALNSQSLSFLTYETILVSLDLVLFEETFEIMLLL